MARKDFISEAIKKPGSLHEDLGVPEGKTIPKSRIAAAAAEGGKVGQRARFAQTLEGMHPGKKTSVKKKKKTAVKQTSNTEPSSSPAFGSPEFAAKYAK